MTTYSAGTVGRAAEETVTYWHGTGTVYTPVTQDQEDAAGRFCACGSAEAHAHARVDRTCPSMAGSSWEEYVTCPHRHTDYAKAQTCGRQLAERTARRRNAGQA